MTLILYDGYYFEEHVKSARTLAKRKKMAASNAKFKEYEFNIDISSITGQNLDEVRVTDNYRMLSMQQIKDTIPHIKSSYDEVLRLRTKNIYASTNAKKLYKYPDSLIKKNLESEILDNFILNEKIAVLNSATSKSSRALSSINNNIDTIKYRRKTLNFFDTEYYNRFAFSLSCLILFFIGAPLGSIIRKGGFGLPMILAIAIYVVYFFSNTFGKNLAEESSITALLGSWIAVIIMAPIGILLTIRATKDKGIFNTDAIVLPITNFFKKIFKRKED